MTEMLDVEVRLRLIEAAVELPVVRIATEPDATKPGSAAAVAHSIAAVWYNNFVGINIPKKIKAGTSVV